MFDDLKFIFIFCFIPLAFFAWTQHYDVSNLDYVPAWEDKSPTVRFVPEGTPGAISMDEFRKMRYDHHEDAWYYRDWP
jgi:hypothetical protein